MRPLSKTAVMLLALTSLSCGNDDHGVSDKKLQEDIQHAATRIGALIVDLSCDSDDQCQYIEYGHKPCGGPADFRIYSARNTDSVLIHEYADEYFRLTREFNRRNGIFSDCAIEMPPDVICDTVCRESAIP